MKKADEIDRCLMELERQGLLESKMRLGPDGKPEKVWRAVDQHPPAN
jgi:hypothetical protein